MLFMTNINLNGNELQNAVVQPLSTAPVNPKLGQIYCNSNTSRIMWYNGTSWVTIGIVVESSATNGNIKVDGVEMSVYSLPIASGTTLGGVKIGTGLTVDANGVVSTVTTNPDWSDIQNKPTDLVQDSSYVHTDNNYTTVDKTKLSGIAAGAEVNVQSDWSQTTNTADDYIKNKPVALSAFTNDSNFITSTVNNLTNYYLKTETYTKTEITDIVSAISTLNIIVVASLPTENISTTTIYLVAKTPTVPNDGYDEYVYVSSTSSWEMIGNTIIDLSNYLTKTGEGKDVKVTYTTSGSRTLPASTESLAIILGKVTKYLTDLKTVAFTGSYNDLSNLPTLIKKSVETLSVATATYTVSGYIVNVIVIDSVTKEQVLTDVTYSNATTMVNNSVNIDVASIPTNPLYIVISYI